MDLSGKVVLITGASSGIGAATAKYLTELGATVVLTGRNVENLNKIGTECEAIGKAKPVLLVADVTKESDNARVIRETISKFGKLDVLVNNAGKGLAGSIETTTLEQYDDIMTTNVRAVLNLTQLAIPHLIKSKGNIVNVSSVAGTRSFANSLAYCISKSALDQFTRCTALELAPKQVRVNSVNPAVIITEFHKRLGMDDAAYDAYLKHSSQTHALGRVGQASEVAAAIAFLAGDTASFITGMCLCVDGGKNIMCPR
ncbi:3-oxoacyl-[acyl-carrier-protein] reductase FabG-like [Topomyia yanbarensis]|uniref:3-oxoacyl-[acyl-carrier-protein] reductase FabG-like n=1 Tax=Topomyia yanbarensis TaxID=2498891 RepID=UPI00273C70F5|nr:3-oxoacyl-[acyl-carrier-protein] reductase FabG-like [Topomyia yanbarensis]